MSSNRSSTLSFSLPPTPEDSRPTSSMSLYSNTSSVYYQPQQVPGNMVYDHRHSVVNYNTHVHRNPSHQHHHSDNRNHNHDNNNMYQYEILDHEVNYPQSLLHKPSVSTIGSNFTQKLHAQQQQSLRKQVTTKGISQQQQQQQTKKVSLPRTPVAKQKTLPLFPTVRTRGSSSIQEALRPGPGQLRQGSVDVTQIELMPIEFSHKIIMSCIDEIKLRGLKHKHLFRNAYYSPSVESVLSNMINSKRRKDVFSVKMMRMDTVGGLLTTALSRTFPPLIPPHIRELFENPKGRFFFELLSLLPELNRFLFVEILDLCCDLVDNQAYNHVSHSKLAIYPGSCCFGLDEYMPTWDTRYLMTPDLKMFSNAFYQVIYAYRDERDLSAEELQQKLDARERQMEQDRWDALEQEHGLVGAAEILKMEARIAQGLPAESPVLPPSDTKEISLYADRKEVVVADDAISVFEMRLDDDEEEDVVPYSNRQRKAVVQPEEENIEQVMTDLRRSVSVASMGQPTSIKVYRESHAYRMYAVSTRTYWRSVRMTTTSARPTPVRTKSIARFSSIHKNVFPVSPGDIMGFSRNAIQQKELQDFLAVARTTVKKRKSVSSKKIIQLRVQNRLLRRSSRSGAKRGGREKHMQITMPCAAQLRRRNSNQSTSPSAVPNLRRGRNRQLRKELEVYLAKGLSQEEATKEREMDIKKEKRKAKMAKQAALARVQTEEAAARAARAAAAAEASEVAEMADMASVKEATDVTMEEAEILEAFDYLSDQEFAEFMELAGLTMADVDRLREKSAKAALSQITKDIHRSGDLNKDGSSTKVLPPATSARTRVATTTTTTEEPEKRLFNLPHMTSMDLLIKNATVIGDSNLRCYPSPVIVPRSGLFTAPVITEHYEEDEEESSSTAGTEVLEELEVLQSDDETETANTAVQSSESLVMKTNPSSVKQQTMFEFETVVFEVEDVDGGKEAEDDEDDEAAELRQLLEAMSEDERSEFLRLSSQETMGVAPLVSTA
ncbi:hypothetical protein BGZ74_009391 [Mortierella antarctica]|nr:hypothetical protein BGZ74_009391 [Mortierella antarctica]